MLEAQRELRALLERQPVHFFVREYYPRLDAARRALAEFLDADPDHLAFVQNATTGVNSVLRSMRFEAGDELLVSNHEYNACRNVLDFVAAQAGARVVVAEIPFPIESPEQVLDAVISAVSERTRLALLDHVTSATGLVLPIERLLRALEERGVVTLVDGAHAPGMLPLSLSSLKPAYYTGNCHKWLCAPKGAGFLYVRPDLQAGVRPAVISHGANTRDESRSRFRHEFDWVGTTDPTAWLSVPVAIETLRGLVPGGWPEIQRRNRELVLAGRRVLLKALGLPEPAPEEMIGSLAALPLPDGPPGTPSPLYVDELQARLHEEHRIEVPVSPWPAPPKRVLRISAQLYNSLSDYEFLASKLPEALGRQSS